LENEKFLTPKELALRWKMSERTLSNWRGQGRGPAYVKIGSSIKYEITVILNYEKGLQK